MPLVLVLHTRRHLDYGELDDELASQYGRISNRLVRIIEHLPEIGRVHRAGGVTAARTSTSGSSPAPPA